MIKKYAEKDVVSQTSSDKDDVNGNVWEAARKRSMQGLRYYYWADIITTRGIPPN